jgi:hypothetical protein
MAWEVAGTRAKTYRVDTPDGVRAWVDDEVDLITQGWMPLTSDRQADGSLRVVYGDASPRPSGRSRPLDVPLAADESLGNDVRLGLWTTLLALIGILSVFGVMARL